MKKPFLYVAATLAVTIPTAFFAAAAWVATDSSVAGKLVASGFISVFYFAFLGLAYAGVSDLVD